MIRVLLITPASDDGAGVLTTYSFKETTCAWAFQSFKRLTPHINKADFSKAIIAGIDNAPTNDTLKRLEFMKTLAGLAGLLLSTSQYTATDGFAFLILDYRRSLLSVRWITQ